MRRMTKGLEWFLSHSVLFSSVMTVASYFTSRLFSTPLGRFDAEYVAFCLGSFTLFHSLVGNQLFDGRVKKIEILRIAILRRDLATFLAYRDNRIEPALLNWLRSLSIVIICGTMIAPFENHWLGLPFVWGVLYIIASFWGTVIELDDPFNGKWNLIVPDETWMTESPRTFFSSPDGKKTPNLSV